VSDADEAVVAWQAYQDTGPIAWARIDTSGTLDRVIAQARSAAGA
jgi:hypothetical protein